MEEKRMKITVKTMGGFAVFYKEKEIQFTQKKTAKTMVMLQLLLYFGKNGITRTKLLENLYGGKEILDVKNSLRVTEHRMKKLLENEGILKDYYILDKKGVYYWNPDIDIEVDVYEFAKKVDQAFETEAEEEQIHLLQEACDMYGGNFLSDLDGEEWVEIEAVLYKNKYSKALHKLCELLSVRGEYEEVLKYSSIACERYPFDEWQAIKIDCYIVMNQFQKALQEYEETAKLFFEELGISPSDRMMKQFELLSNRLDFTPQAIVEIQRRLEEAEGQSGAYYCSLPSFRDSYRVLARSLERSGAPLFLMMCSIVSAGKRELDEKKQQLLLEELEQSIRSCLRRGDAFTKYSPTQYLILLVGAEKEQCVRVFCRIEKYFTRDHKNWKRYLEHYIVPVVEVDEKSSLIEFQEESTT